MFINGPKDAIKSQFIMSYLASWLEASYIDREE